MTNQTEEQVSARRKVSKKLVELLKQNVVVPIKNVDASRLNALAVYDEIIYSRGDYSNFIFKYAVVNNASITKTPKGNYILEGEKVSEIWESQTHNGWFYRKIFGQPARFIGWSIILGHSETESFVKLLQERNVVIPLYKED
jgi:hypothetical protein